MTGKSPKRVCPVCGSDDYHFRHRKTIPPDAEKNQSEAVETKYRCKACEYEWRERASK